MSKEYNENSIQVLSALDHMKRRFGMYIGSNQDARQLLSEIIDNAIDEVQAGFSPELIINIDTKENIYTVRDFGRGIPHGKKEFDNGVQKEIVEVLLTESNSGGKFDTTAYNYSSGLNGLGLTITNALSDFIQIETYRDGNAVIGRDEKGSGNVTVRYEKTNEPNGTKVIFKPCKKYFNSEKIPIEFAKDRCRVASAMGFRARLFVEGKEVETNATIFDLIKEEENSKVSTYVDIGPMEVTSSSEEKMKVAIRYTSETNDRYFGFTNLLSNYLGGTHIQELSKTTIASWKEFVEEHKNVKPAVELRNDDYLVGLRAVCAVFISHPEYSSQTKEKLVVNRKYFEELMLLFKKEFKQYLEDNITIAAQLLKRFEEYRIAQNQLLSRKEISSLIKINNDDSDNIRRRSVVSKLVECSSGKRDDTDLYMVEGNSALGPFLFTRNVKLQAVLPLRGKILNITNKSVKEAVKNSEICDIANSVGCGIGSSCDASKSRYDKIIIAADADPDGQQITCLVLSVFINMFPDLVKAGRVYIAEPPLYCWGDSPKTYGWCNKIEDVPKGISFTRMKGLGEMQDSQIDYFLVNPETRNIKQVQFPSDINEFNSILGTTTGKRNLLEELGIIEVGN